MAPSGYRLQARLQRIPALQSDRTKRDLILVPQIKRVWDSNWQVYGADKVWKQMNREGIAVARCTVERLMRQQGLCGVRRGKAIRTLTPDKSAPCPLARVTREFNADRPNKSWEIGRGEGRERG